MLTNYSVKADCKNAIEKALSFAGLICLIMFSIILVKDFVSFQNLTSESYKTPWYANNMTEPYTTARLFFADKSNVTEYWTKNAIGSESWLVREVKVGDTTFWTLLERNEIK